MFSKSRIIYLGCRNTYEEIEALYEPLVMQLQGSLSKSLEKAIRRIGVPIQRKGKKIKFFRVTADEAEQKNESGRSVLAAMSDIAYDPIAFIYAEDIDRILEKSPPYDKIGTPVNAAYEEYLISEFYEALKLVPDDDYPIGY